MPTLGQEVLCQVLSESLAAVEGKGVNVDLALQRRGLDAVLIRDPKNRIAWETFTLVLRALGDHLTEAEFRAAGEKFCANDGFALNAFLFRTLFTVREGYVSFYGHPGASGSAWARQVECLETRCEDRGPHGLSLTLKLLPGFAMSREFFWLAQGVAAGLPSVWGLPKAHLETVWHGNGVHLHIAVPEKRPWLAWLGRRLSLRSASRWLSRELLMTNQALHEKTRDLEERVAELQAARAACEAERLRAEMASQAKNDFLSTMSHELRTPLNGIVGLSELLAESLPRGEDRSDAKSIAECGDTLRSLIDRILEYSQLAHVQGAAQNVEVDVPALLRELGECYAPKCYAKNLDFQLSIPGTLPPLLSDTRRIRGILAAFLDNAVKFTDHGKIALAVRLEGQALIFEVEDTGPGMTSQQMPRLFKLFEIGHPSLNSRYGGAGLGLALAAKLSESLGGAVSASSRIGEGASFSLRLALTQPPLTLGVVRPDWTGASEDFTPVASGPLKILLAEDNDMNRDVTKRILEKSGHSVDVAKHGLEAAIAAKAKTYDVILLDIRMPVMDGLAAAKSILRSVTEKPRLIALTANAGEADRQACLEAGFDVFLPKPVSPQELLDALTRNPAISRRSKPASS